MTAKASSTVCCLSARPLVLFFVMEPSFFLRLISIPIVAMGRVRPSPVGMCLVRPHGGVGMACGVGGWASRSKRSRSIRRHHTAPKSCARDRIVGSTTSHTSSSTAAHNRQHRLDTLGLVTPGSLVCDTFELAMRCVPTHIGGWTRWARMVSRSYS